ncbi:hypothetical protein HZA44_03065 [Candidatus Peregrinibacteria bacterium]|nr:hypothetical protein [Candidatus Peregrinibacteria bacterium]
MNKQLANAILAGLLILAIGLASGYSLGFARGSRGRFPEIKTVGDLNTGVATLKLKGVGGGKLTGEAAGQTVRIVSGANEIREVKIGETFEIPVSTIALSTPVAPAIPANAQFMASKRGKVYYSVFDARGLEIAPQNRVYFNSEAEAEKAGFRKSTTSP